MATASAGDGNWGTAGTWSAGVPDATDVVTITHTVTITDTNAVALSVILDGSGKLVMNAGTTLTLTDNASAYIQINSDATGFDSAGTSASPCTIQSASSNPTNYWYISVEDQTTIPDSRTLDFTYVEMKGNKWCLGNDTYYVRMNDGTAASGTITTVTPLVREPQLTIHYAEGRSASRVYQLGTHAGVVTVSGTIPLSSWTFQKLSDLIASKERLSFFSKYTHLPTCRIERASFRPTGGGYVEFTITLVEDK